MVTQKQVKVLAVLREAKQPLLFDQICKRMAVCNEINPSTLRNHIFSLKALGYVTAIKTSNKKKVYLISSEGNEELAIYTSNLVNSCPIRDDSKKKIIIK